jgi:hypothetical protein
MPDLLQATPEMAIEYARWFVTAARTLSNQIHPIPHRGATTTIAHANVATPWS